MKYFLDFLCPTLDHSWVGLLLFPLSSWEWGIKAEDKTFPTVKQLGFTSLGFSKFRKLLMLQHVVWIDCMGESRVIFSCLGGTELKLIVSL